MIACVTLGGKRPSHANIGIRQVLGRVRDTVSTAARRPDLAELERPALEAALAEHGHEPFRARQVFGWIYRRGVTDPGAMSNLPRDLRATLTSDFAFTTPHVLSRECSNDGTEKFLLELGDGERIESVFIPDPPANTFCGANQVGAAM